MRSWAAARAFANAALPQGDHHCCEPLGQVNQNTTRTKGRGEASNAAPVLEPTEHALDEIALLVDVGIEGMEALAGRVVGDHRLGPALAQELA